MYREYPMKWPCVLVFSLARCSRTVREVGGCVATLGPFCDTCIKRLMACDRQNYKRCASFEHSAYYYSSRCIAVIRYFPLYVIV